LLPRREFSILPGFGLTLGISLAWLSVIVLIPLVMLVLSGIGVGPAGITRVLSSPRVLASLWLSLWASLLASFITMVIGLLLAWVLVRYSFPGKKIVDALIDLPIALPTAIAGIALTQLYAPSGWLGYPLAQLGIKVAYAPLGIIVALVFIGIPLVVRAVQPVLSQVDPSLEEAAGSMGASRWQVFWHVILPQIFPALLAGGVMAAGRGFGEYGSVVFISSNKPFVGEIAPLLIVTRLEEFDYAGATVIALAMLVISLSLLLAGNLLGAAARKMAGQS